MAGTAGRTVLWRLRKQLHGGRRAGKCWADFMAERLRSRVSAGVTQHHNSLQIVSWKFFNLVHMDDLRGTGPRPALDLVQTNLSQIWTVHVVGDHLKRERVLHNDKTEITPNHKFLRVVLHSMGLTNCKPTPTPSVVGCVKHRSYDDVDLGVQECRIHRGIVGSLQCLSIDRYDVQFETHACAKEMKQPTTASWTQLKRLARYLAGTPDSESCTHETWR